MNIFWSDYPLTQGMTGRELACDDATLRSEVRIFVAFIGAGSASRALFAQSVSINQFLSRSNGKLCAHAVRYAVYDPEGAADAQAFCPGLYAYCAALPGMRARSEEFLPLPEAPAEYSVHAMPVGSGLYEALCGELSAATYGYVIAAYSDGSENAQIAAAVAREAAARGLAGRVRVFFSENGSDPEAAVRPVEGAPSAGPTRAALDRMAFLRHYIYTSEAGRGAPDAEQTALAQWREDGSRALRTTNFLACQSLRMKLQLLGFDLAAAGDSRPDASAEFLCGYQANDPIRWERENGAPRTVGGKRFAVYRNDDFERDSVRRTLAVQEHLRWNAYMICDGYLPVTVREICSPNKGKIPGEKRHRNLTTFEGLVRYRGLMADVHGMDPEAADVVRYDYQLMDDAVWLAGAAGYKIVKK